MFMLRALSALLEWICALPLLLLSSLLIDFNFRPKDNATAASSSSSTSKEKEKRSSRGGRGGSGRGRGRGGRRQAETIQTHSIFEQGPMERSNKGRKLG